MPAVADLQAHVARALVANSAPACAELLVGGANPSQRFAIHSRHYGASVARALVERFAATVWLVGSEPVIRAAAAFVREHPPTAPCMAEYGDQFPGFLESFAGSVLPPYVGQFASLDWHLGRLAISTNAPAVTSLAHCAPTRIADVRLTLQDGVVYVSITWSLDELMAFYLSGEAPDSYVLREETVWVELRGSRGELSMRRLARGGYVFREALAQGSSLGDAAALAVNAEASFSPSDALIALLREGLVTGVRDIKEERDDACRD